MNEETEAPRLKPVSDLTNDDLIIFQLADERVFIGFSRGMIEGFLYVHGSYQIHSSDLSDPAATRFFPYMYGMTDNTRGYNLQSVTMITTASSIMVTLFEKCLREHSTMLLLKSSGGTTDLLKQIPIESPIFDLISDIIETPPTANKRTKH